MHYLSTPSPFQDLTVYSSEWQDIWWAVNCICCGGKVSRPNLIYSFVTLQRDHCGTHLFSVAQQVNSGLGLDVEVSRSHTIKHTYSTELLCTSDRLRRRGCYLHDRQKTQEADIQVLSGIWTRNPRNQAASNLRLTPHSHWDRLVEPIDILDIILK
jgi:hypothetical protein